MGNIELKIDSKNDSKIDSNNDSKLYSKNDPRLHSMFYNMPFFNIRLVIIPPPISPLDYISD